MAIRYQILGSPGRDNAMLATVDTGQGMHRLLFDCGDRCLDPLGLREIHEIDHVFFSHFHMDHVAGFDAFFRCVFGRREKENHLWGPPGAAEILQHRFRGFLWNLIPQHHEVFWHVHEVHEDRLLTWRFRLLDAFARAELVGDAPRNGAVLRHPDFRVDAVLMEHNGPCVAYVLREPERVSVDPERLAGLDLPRGAWLKQVKDPAFEGEVVTVAGTEYRVQDLRQRLLVTAPGDSLAYLTDFLLDEPAEASLLPLLSGCDTIVCESQYRQAEEQMAIEKHHMTAVQAARLAGKAAAGRLVLFHLSDRYTPGEWAELLAEARAVYPAASFPVEWESLA